MVHVTKNEATFECEGMTAGVMVLDDPFKPYLHPLRTPAGYVVTQACPMDHRHHKGLMYALRCADLNFWEESPGQADCGVQEVVSTELTEDGNGVQQELLWKHEAHGTNLDTYRETRHVRCRYDASTQGFVWTWSSHREALRDHRLIMSGWSMPNTKGDRINYHGLGIRLPRSWAFPIETMRGCTVAEKSMEWREAHGTAAEEVTLWGSFDGHWDPPAGSVTFRQEHGYSHFVLMDGFAYLSAGPSNAAELDVRAGEIFEEAFTIEVADRSTS